MKSELASAYARLSDDLFPPWLVAGPSSGGASAWDPLPIRCLNPNRCAARISPRMHSLSVWPRSVLLLLGVFLLSNSRTEAQHLKLGVIGGTAATADYSTAYTPESSVTFPDGTVFVRPASSVGPASRSPIGGPMLEWEFNDRFSVEINAIYRRLRLEGDPAVPTVTWQFHVLAKYRLPLGPVQPFIEAGPSFRTTGNLNTNPSHHGLTAGAGFDWQWRGFRLGPVVRYTRWAADPVGTHQSKRDQIEALFAVSRGVASDRHPLGGRVALGVVGGSMLVRPVRSTRYSGVLSGPDLPPDAQVDISRAYFRSWIVGPRIEVGLTSRWSVLTEANYRQIRYRETTSYDLIDTGGNRRRDEVSFEGKSAVLWQFPLLLKYRLTGRSVEPFFEAGPSLRLPQDIAGQLSTVGLTAGVGVRLKSLDVNIEPGLRFSHWGSTKYQSGETGTNDVRRDQLDAVFAVTF